MDDRTVDDPVQAEILKFYANPQQSVENFALKKYGITAAQLRNDRKKRDSIKMELYLENYANQGVQHQKEKDPGQDIYENLELQFQNIYLQQKFQDQTRQELDYDEMLDLRREVKTEFQKYREQARLEYESDYRDYLRLNQYEQQILAKHQIDENLPLTEMISDFAAFKF